MVIPCDPALRVRLIAVAQGLESPDLLIRGAKIWNAFTGEILAGDVAVCADRIAKVGPWEGPVSDSAQVIDADGRTAVPGYIEPHSHPWPFANPLSLGEAVVCRGTTCLVYDELLLHLALGTERLLKLTAELSAASLPHVFWAARITSQSRFAGERELFSREAIRGLLNAPHFLGTGEMTRWTDLLDPERSPRLLELFEDARLIGKFNDGHTAGAAPRRLSALAAAGLRSCHEAIGAEEALERLRQGFWVLLRNSSFREDLRELLPALKASAFQDRFAYTTDGAKMHYIEEVGFTDHLIRIALGSGVRANTAYRMATLNAASFLRLDEDLGSVSPGRIADVNLLGSLDDPTPELVVCRGRLAARDGSLAVSPPSEGFPWESSYAGSQPLIPAWAPDDFLLPSGSPDPFPAARLANAVITREAPVRLAARGPGFWPDDRESLVLALTNRRGEWITRGVVQNLAPGLEALATTYTNNTGTLVLGRNPDAMSEALARLRRIGGGVTLCSRSRRWAEFPMPLAGIHLMGGRREASRAAESFQAEMEENGYLHADPNYTFLFLSSDVLPEVRATEAGWIRIKTGDVLLPSQRMCES